MEPEAYHESDASTVALAPRLDAHAASAPDSQSEAEQKARFQQHLVTALIVVTSIIAVLLFFLIRTDRLRSSPKQRFPTDSLPPTEDPDIEAIDTAIRNHLHTYERL